MSDKKKNKFDLIIIGAGSAGLSVAAGAVQLGYSTALIEKGEMGGDCLNTGCVPSKALLAAAKHAQYMRQSNQFGIKNNTPDIDFSAVKDHVFNVIKQIEPNDSVERFTGLGVNVIQGAAKFVNPHSIDVEGRIITADHIVIATGSRASIPPIEGLDADKALTNENIFDLREAPEHLLIIGGGPIGIEMAQAHKRLGCDVTVFDMADILPQDDPELTDTIRKTLIDEGVRLEENIKIKSVHHTKEAVTITIDKDGEEKKIRGSHILVAAGRAVNIDGLDLEKAGVDYDKKGIETNKRLRTSQRHIFAAGDVAGGPQFTHVAGYHAGIIIKNMIFKIPASIDYSALPWATYTDPELAHVGMTLKQAQEKHGESLKTVEWEFEENDRAIAERHQAGKIKVLTDKRGRILGVSIVGSHAGELISMWGLAISQKMKIGAVANMIVPYPTLAEVGKRAASSYYTPSLFSEKTRTLVSFLKKLPF